MTDQKKAVAVRKVAATQNGMMNPEMLISQAITEKVPVDMLERLLAMRAELRAEQAREAFANDMADFQSACPVITKGKKVLNKDKSSVRYQYAPLEEIIKQTRDVRRTYGFSHSFDTQVSTELKEVKVICTIKHRLGHTERSEFQVPTDPESYMNAPQKFASAMTYAKRYAFINAMGITLGGEDNDARTAPKNDKYTVVQMAEIEKLGKEAGLTQAEVVQGIRKHFGVSITQLTATQADGVIVMLKKTIADKEEGKAV